MWKRSRRVGGRNGKLGGGKRRVIRGECRVGARLERWGNESKCEPTNQRRGQWRLTSTGRSTKLSILSIYLSEFNLRVLEWK